MNTTLATIAKNIGLALIESTALLLASNIVGHALKKSTTDATQSIMQAIRFTKNRIQEKRQAA